MIDLPWTTLLSAALIVTLAYTVYGLTGFGAAIIGIPLLAHFFPLRFAVPMMLVFDVCTGALLGLRHRRSLDRPEMLRLLPWLLAGMLAGVTLLVHASERWLLLVLGCFVIGYSAWSLLNKRPPSTVSPRWAVPAGLVGGAFTSLYGTGGPIYAIYLARRLSNKDLLRATMGTLVFGTALVRVLLFTGSGFYRQAGLLALGFALLPCALLGYWLGSRLHARIDTKRATQLVWLLLLCGGTSLILRSLRGA